MTEATVVARLRSAGCVFAEDEARLLVAQAGTADELIAMVDRRVSGVPLEQVLGWAEFCGLRVAVRPGVFVPRRRSELLVRAARPLLPPGGVVVDLCCGSGAVGLALVSSAGHVELHAVDVDPAAVTCARDNLATLAPGQGLVYQGDLYVALPARLRGRVDVLVANAPYVPTAAVALMPPEAREHEPRAALDGGTDGLDVVRRIVAGAPEWLAASGRVLVETSAAQAPVVVDAIGAAGLLPDVLHHDGLDATIVTARFPTPPVPHQTGTHDRTG
jgi:release factor glutamine methyltransferase